MRTTCAQNYVIITMGKLEIKFLAISRLQPLKQWRYIDDIYMIWPNTLQLLSSYLEALNSFHKNIRFIKEGSDTEANFLNVTVHKDNQGHIQTAFYTPHPHQKDSKLNKYLHYSSFLLNLRNKVYKTARPYDICGMNHSAQETSTYPYKISIPSFQLKTSLHCIMQI